MRRLAEAEAADRAGVEVLVRDRLVADVDTAAELGMCGAPTMLIDEELVCPHPMRAAVARPWLRAAPSHLGLLSAVVAYGWSIAVSAGAVLR